MYPPLLPSGGASRRRVIVAARQCVWFSQFEAQQLVLGDPDVRDALLHALQAAAPHRRVVPISVERISFHPGNQPVRMEAVERDATDESFQFDIVARDKTGRIVERWQDVAFRAISRIHNIDEVLAAAPALVPAYVERVARAALGDASIEVALIFDRHMPREERRSRALSALGLDGRVFSRTDGRPILVGCDPRLSLSIAHRDGATLAVRAAGDIGCDIEAVADWLGADACSPLSTSMGALAAELAADSEPLAVAAARVWSVCEATTKHAQPLERHWKTYGHRTDGVVLFETAFGRTATMLIPGPDGDIVIAIALRTMDPLIAAIGPTDVHERTGRL
jgi:enediyne polyketide synthase